MDLEKHSQTIDSIINSVKEEEKYFKINFEYKLKNISGNFYKSIQESKQNYGDTLPNDYQPHLDSGFNKLSNLKSVKSFIDSLLAKSKSSVTQLSNLKNDIKSHTHDNEVLEKYFFIEKNEALNLVSIFQELKEKCDENFEFLKTSTSKIDSLNLIK